MQLRSYKIKHGSQRCLFQKYYKYYIIYSIYKCNT